MKQNLQFFFLASLIASITSATVAASPFRDAVADAQANRIRSDIKDRQKKLETALNDYADPNCLKKAIYGTEHYKNVYNLFIQCARDANKCAFSQEQLKDAPESLLKLADAVRLRNYHLQAHVEVTAQIKELENKREALANAQ